MKIAAAPAPARGCEIGALCLFLSGVTRCVTDRFAGHSRQRNFNIQGGHAIVKETTILFARFPANACVCSQHLLTLLLRSHPQGWIPCTKLG
jgi:hypothetical protein